MVLRSDHHGGVVWLGELFLNRLDQVVAQNDRHDSLDLQQTELLAHALMHACSEPEVGEGGLLLVALLIEAIWIEGIRVLEDLRKPSGNSYKMLELD